MIHRKRPDNPPNQNQMIHRALSDDPPTIFTDTKLSKGKNHKADNRDKEKSKKTTVTAEEMISEFIIVCVKNGRGGGDIRYVADYRCVACDSLYKLLSAPVRVKLGDASKPQTLAQNLAFREILRHIY